MPLKHPIRCLSAGFNHARSRPVAQEIRASPSCSAASGRRHRDEGASRDDPSGRVSATRLTASAPGMARRPASSPHLNCGGCALAPRSLGLQLCSGTPAERTSPRSASGPGSAFHENFMATSAAAAVRQASRDREVDRFSQRTYRERHRQPEGYRRPRCKGVSCSSHRD
jgi:hypothetical protein